MAFDFKNASAADRKREYDRIARELGDDQFFTKKELNHLPEVLAPGEDILAFTSGLMDGNTWLITLTDQRVIFLDKGLLYGLKQVSIDLDKVNAVAGETGMFFGKIEIQDGATSRVISNVLKKTVVPFTNRVRDIIQKRKMKHVESAPVAKEDIVGKLERLAALLDKGILTTEEFQQQKAKLLAA